MEPTATIPPARKPKILIIVFFLALLLAIANAGLYYFFSRKQKFVGGNGNTHGQIIRKHPLINTETLPNAKVGADYQAVIFITLQNANTEISGQIISGLPPGLNFNGCVTKFNDPIDTIFQVNSVARCTLEGTPGKDGNYTLVFLASSQDDTLNTKGNISLTVEP